MTTTASTKPETPAAKKHMPGRTLSRAQLTLALIFVTLIPFGLVVFLYTQMPDYRDPVLDADVAIAPRAWPSEADPNARVVPCLVLTNPTQDEWRELNMSINDQFHFFDPDPVPPGKEVHVPLKFFHTKGNQFYPPDRQELKSVTIYAQIPSGARAILHIEDPSLDAALR